MLVWSCKAGRGLNYLGKTYFMPQSLDNEKKKKEQLIACFLWLVTSSKSHSAGWELGMLSLYTAAASRKDCLPHRASNENLHRLARSGIEIGFYSAKWFSVSLREESVNSSNRASRLLKFGSMIYFHCCQPKYFSTWELDMPVVCCDWL